MGPDDTGFPLGQKFRLRELLKIHPHCVEGSGREVGSSAPPTGRGEARRAEFVRGAHRETEIAKKVEAHAACELVSETVEGWCTHI